MQRCIWAAVGERSEARGDNTNMKRQSLEEIEEKGADTLTSDSLLASSYEPVLTGEGMIFTAAERERAGLQPC